MINEYNSMKKFILFFWSLRKEFIKYFIVGVSAVIVDMGSLYLLRDYIGLPATVAVVFNQPVILTSIFFVNKHWSFKAGGLTHKQMIRFFTLSAANYLFSVSWMFLLHDKFSVNYLFTRLANIILAVCWNFLLYKYWVYRDEVQSPKSKVQS